MKEAANYSCFKKLGKEVSASAHKAQLLVVFRGCLNPTAVLNVISVYKLGKDEGGGAEENAYSQTETVQMKSHEMFPSMDAVDDQILEVKKLHKSLPGIFSSRGNEDFSFNNSGRTAFLNDFRLPMLAQRVCRRDLYLIFPKVFFVCK